MAFDIQAFICERAQDLAPEQSRQLLGQHQQLQGAYHQASGRAQAWANALSAQMTREEEWQRRERVKEEKDRERESAREREVWKTVTGSCRFASLPCFSRCNLKLSAKLLTSGFFLAMLSHTIISLSKYHLSGSNLDSIELTCVIIHHPLLCTCNIVQHISINTQPLSPSPPFLL